MADLLYWGRLREAKFLPKASETFETTFFLGNQLKEMIVNVVGSPHSANSLKINFQIIFKRMARKAF